MQAEGTSRSGVLQWVVVLVVGVLVVTLVLGLNLDPASQRRAEGARRRRGPRSPPQRLVGARAGINLHLHERRHGGPDHEPARRGPPAEVPQLIALRLAAERPLAGAGRRGAAEELPAHASRFFRRSRSRPITAELPGPARVPREVAEHVSQTELLAALKTNFPALTQAIANLPTVTNGWDSIPGIDGLTRFDGSTVQSVPAAADVLQLGPDPGARDAAGQLRQPGRHLVGQLDRAAAAASSGIDRDRVRRS